MLSTSALQEDWSQIVLHQSYAPLSPVLFVSLTRLKHVLNQLYSHAVLFTYDNPI